MDYHPTRRNKKNRLIPRSLLGEFLRLGLAGPQTTKVALSTGRLAYPIRSGVGIPGSSATNQKLLDRKGFFIKKRNDIS